MYSYQTESYLRNNQNSMPSLYAPEEGYEKGNTFKNLYVPYKNYKPAKLQARNQREALLLELSKYGFAAHELNLYLDLHPEDRSVLQLFNDYSMQAKKLIEEYENKYGPLKVSSDVMQTSFTWQENAWPWEGGNN